MDLARGRGGRVLRYEVRGRGAQRSALRRASVAARLGMNRTTLQAQIKNWALLVRSKVDISTLAD